MVTFINYQKNLTYVIITVLLIGIAGCKQSQQIPVQSQPAVIKPLATQPATTQLVATKPAATLPASTYDSKPPYQVKLYVRKPEDKQPGWLKILELANSDVPATAEGTFPQQNRFYVDTNNVSQVSIDINHLPLAPRKRIILQIDKQGIEIARKKGRKYVTLQQRPTGEWVVVKTPK